MSSARDQAAASLAEIAAVREKTKAAIAYRRASAYLFLWGPLLAAASLLNQAFPGQTAVIWLAADAIGFAGLP